MFTSIDNDRPYAGKALARNIDEKAVKPYGLLNSLLVACGFEFVENTMGDKLYKHAATGEVIRMKYINRDAWQVEREPVEEAKTAYLQFGEWGGPYQTVKAEAVAEVPMAHHKAGLSYTRSGYGKKIPTVYMIKYDGVWRRVYCAIFSNSGTTYVKYEGKDVVVRLDD